MANHTGNKGMPQIPKDGVERDCTTRELAEEMGISHQAVSQIEERAIAKLKKHPLGRQLWENYCGGR